MVATLDATMAQNSLQRAVPKLNILRGMPLSSCVSFLWEFGGRFRLMTMGSFNLSTHLLSSFISPPVLLWRGLAYLFVLDIDVYL